MGQLPVRKGTSCLKFSECPEQQANPDAARASWCRNRTINDMITGQGSGRADSASD